MLQFPVAIHLVPGAKIRESIVPFVVSPSADAADNGASVDAD
jgi:hypothetical protein